MYRSVALSLMVSLAHMLILPMQHMVSSLAFNRDGKWSYWDDWASTDEVVDVALSIYTDAVMDANYDIYLIEFEDEWKLVNPSKSSTSQPDVFAIDDTLFLVQDGIWKYIYEETAWKLYHPLAENVQYLGNDTNNVWLSDSQHLIRYTIANNEIKGYYLKDLNLSPDAELVEVVTDRSKTYLVTRNEVIRIDDESWDLADVPDTVHGITSIGVLSNGAWLIASSDLDLVAQGWSTVSTYTLVKRPHPSHCPPHFYFGDCKVLAHSLFKSSNNLVLNEARS